MKKYYKYTCNINNKNYYYYYYLHSASYLHNYLSEKQVCAYGWVWAHAWEYECVSVLVRWWGEYYLYSWQANLK